MPKLIRSLALDFPDICLQFFMGILVGRKKKKLHTTLYIFTRLPTRQDGPNPTLTLSRNLITVMIRFSTLLPISAPFRISPQ